MIKFEAVYLRFTLKFIDSGEYNEKYKNNSILLKIFVHHCVVDDLAVSLKPTWEAFLTLGGFIKIHQ